MGCAASSAVTDKAAPPEPVPTYEALCQIQVTADPSEPHVWCSSSDKVNTDDLIHPEQTLSLIFRKIGTSNKGDVFQLENLHDQLYHGIQIHPAVTGLNVRKRLEGLVYCHYEQDLGRNPLCYAVKNVPKGLNHYVLLRTKPLYEGQAKSLIESPLSECYTYAGVEFDYQAKMGKIKTVYHPASQGKDVPRYTFYQCNPNVWVIKKMGTICAAINQWKGMAKLTCYRLIVCKGEDPIFVSLVAHCIDSFMAVAKTQGKSATE